MCTEHTTAVPLAAVARLYAPTTSSLHIGGAVVSVGLCCWLAAALLALAAALLHWRACCDRPLYGLQLYIHISTIYREIYHTRVCVCGLCVVH